MIEPRKLSALERTFVSAMQMLSELTQGYSVGFMEELIRQHGVSGFFKWAQGTNRGWSALVDRYGERQAHLLATFASFGNGCHYCAYGHQLAHNLHYFEEREELYPIDEAALAGLMVERDAIVQEFVVKRLAGPAFERDLPLIERIFALRDGEPARSGDDQSLVKALALYEWINECSIMTEDIAPPMGTIAKNKVLRQRYEQARARQRELDLAKAG